MKKQILNIGKLLNKTEQKQVKGGDGSIFSDPETCKNHCRNLYDRYGVCCLINQTQYMCDNFHGDYGC